MKKTFKKLAVLLIAAFSLSLFNGVQNAEAAYADGEYTLPFTILQGNSNEQSKTNDYVVSPAKLIVKNGKYTVQMTLKNSSWWKSFTVESKPVKVISDSNDKRVVQFEVSDVNKLVKGHIHIVVPDINYDSSYDIRLQFDTSKIGAGKASSSGNSASGEKAEENPPTGDNAPIFMLAIALLVSGAVLFRKLAFR